MVLAQATTDVVLTEAYYFFTVAIMWLLHVGFMTYEAGVSRRKNVMSTAMKNIMTIAVVTPTFYYVGFWIYFCMQEGLMFTVSGTGQGNAGEGAYFCGDGYVVPWDASFAPNIGDNLTGVFWAAFVLFAWTTGSIMSGSVLERIRITGYLWLTALMGGVIWVIAAAWGWSYGGWLTIHFGYHDLAASGVVHGIAGIFALGVLFNLGPRIGRYDANGGARVFKPHNLHLTLMGLMIIFTGFYAFYAACLYIQAGTVGGYVNIWFIPTTLSAITYTITMAFAGGFAGGYVFSRGDPFWTISGGLAGVVAVSAGADIYSPSLTLLLAFFSAGLCYFIGGWIETKARIDDCVGAVAVHGVMGFWGVMLVGIFAGGFPASGVVDVQTSFLGQLVGAAAMIPLAFFSGYIASWILKQFNMLRVPPEVEIEGLDMAEFETDFYPEFGRADEPVVHADGSVEPADATLRAAYAANR